MQAFVDNIQTVSNDAEETSAVANNVLQSANRMAEDSGKLRHAVESFISEVKAI